MKWTNEIEARGQIKEMVAQYYHDFKEKKEKLLDRYESFKARWY